MMCQRGTSWSLLFADSRGAPLLVSSIELDGGLKEAMYVEGQRQKLGIKSGTVLALGAVIA